MEGPRIGLKINCFPLIIIKVTIRDWFGLLNVISMNNHKPFNNNFQTWGRYFLHSSHIIVDDIKHCDLNNFTLVCELSSLTIIQLNNTFPKLPTICIEVMFGMEFMKQRKIKDFNPGCYSQYFFAGDDVSTLVIVTLFNRFKISHLLYWVISLTVDNNIMNKGMEYGKICLNLSKSRDFG